MSLLMDVAPEACGPPEPRGAFSDMRCWHSVSRDSHFVRYRTKSQLREGTYRSHSTIQKGSLPPPPQPCGHSCLRSLIHIKGRPGADRPPPQLDGLCIPIRRFTQLSRSLGSHTDAPRGLRRCGTHQNFTKEIRSLEKRWCPEED